jgi:MFS family permease
MPPDTSAGTLKSRSYIGLLVAQFLACFNDQAIHYVAVFYAVDMLVRYVGLRSFDVKGLAAIVTSCFIAPFLLFSPLAGVLADKYSKRSTIVFWKIAEVGIMGLVFAAFLLPHVAGLSTSSVVWSASMLIGAVFLMGTHSTFFIPAKYGVMPEILHPSVLSRGNGLLEGSSFTGNILGTVFGGLVYVKYRSAFDPRTGILTLGQEWILGSILLGLACLGVIAALVMPRMPAADPNRKMEWNPWVPVRDNLRVLRRSRPLVLATVGIAFFTFMVLFFRLILIFEGETTKDFKENQSTYKQVVAAQKAGHIPGSAATNPSTASRPSGDAPTQSWDEGLMDELFSGEMTPGESFADDESLDELASETPVVSATPPGSAHEPMEADRDTREELRVAILIAFIGLGVGIGCATAGMISGDRIELGLVPLGGVLIVLFTAALAYVTASPWSPRAVAWIIPVTLVAVGIGAGLYIVPLYTLLQHRAPKESKGNLVALSNFLNVTGGLIAVGMFYFVTFGLQRLFGLNLSSKDAVQSQERMHDFVLQLQRQMQIPRMLFLSASLITLLIVYLLCRQRPDFLLRTISWFRLPGRRHLHTVGLANVPGEGHVILATNCHETDAWIYVMSAIDRRTCYLRPEPSAGRILAPSAARLESLARRLGLLVALPEAATEPDWNRMVGAGVDTLVAGYLVAMTLDRPEPQGTFTGPISDNPGGSAEDLYADLQARVPSTVLPVYCDPNWPGSPDHPHACARALVLIGKPLPPDATVTEIRAAIRALAATQVA